MKMNLVIWDLNASAKTIVWKFGVYEVAAIVPIHFFHLEYLLSLKQLIVLLLAWMTQWQATAQ